MNKNELLNVYKNHITEVTHTTCGETYVEVSADYLYELVTEVVSMLNGTLMTMFCVDELKYNHKNTAAAKNSRYKIYYAFRIQSANNDEIKKELLVITISVGEKEPEIASITDICLAANWYEREIFDMFGIYPRNHLELAGLIHHHDFPKDVFPMRKDFAASTKIAEVNKIEAKPKVLGGGTYLLPVGPIHAGIIEPGHFRFSCFGEHIINLDAQLFYTHKGLEKITEGMNHINANFIAERVCGVCSLSHSVAYSQAVEKIASAEVPARARTIRVILLELERMAGHLTDLMGIAVDVAYYHASNFISKLREDIQSAAYEVLRSRYFRSINMPGGLRRDISADSIKILLGAALKIKKDIRTAEDMLYNSTTFLERVETTGRLFTKTARSLGVVGVGARGSNISCDARKAFNYEIYDKLVFSEITHTGLDVYARMCVRFNEIKESAAIIEQAAAMLKPGPVVVNIGKPPAFKPAFGITESPKGEHTHFLIFDDDSKLYRYHLRSASYANWLALTFAVKGDIVPDFPVINKSFNLCYCSCDK